MVSHGGQRGRVTAIRDMIRRKRDRELLKMSEEHFRAIADYTYDCETWMAPEGRLV